MGIGLGIVLVLVGAILAFAVDVDVPYVSDDALGFILIVVGVIAIALAFAINHQRANTSHQTRVEERHIDDGR